MIMLSVCVFLFNFVYEWSVNWYISYISLWVNPRNPKHINIVVNRCRM